MNMIKLNYVPKIGDIIQGNQVTEVRKDGVVFGLKGKLSDTDINTLQKHFDGGARGYCFRPGRQFAVFSLKVKTTFRAKKTKQTAAEKYVEVLGFTAREVWQKNRGITLAELTGVGDEIYLELEGLHTTKRLIQKLQEKGLRLVTDLPTWGGHKYLFAQYEGDEVITGLLGNVILTRYKGAGFALTICNHFAHGDTF